VNILITDLHTNDKCKHLTVNVFTAKYFFSNSYLYRNFTYLLDFGLGLPPVHFPNLGLESGAEPPATGVGAYNPRKTFGILYVILCIFMQSSGSYL